MTDQILHEVVLEDDAPIDEISEASRRGFLKGITGASIAGLGAALAGGGSILSTFVSARPAMAAPTGYLVMEHPFGCRGGGTACLSRGCSMTYSLSSCWR